jgi:hypothetical protein
MVGFHRIAPQGMKPRGVGRIPRQGPPAIDLAAEEGSFPGVPG